ncbi:MAG: T9SS type A sorting domain-containing protein, partial [Bacteroidota bacterium]
NESWLEFPAGQTKYGLVRDGNWGTAEIPLIDFAGLIAFQDMNYMFAIASVDGAFPSSTFQFAVDNIVWEDGQNSGNNLPAPWVGQDIGAVSAAGSATYGNASFTIDASGADIWNNADEFHFVYQSLDGDGEITARVNSLTNTNSWAKAGVMIRESLDAGSKHAMTIARPGSGGVSFQRRTATNGSSASTLEAGIALAEWVRIVRSGNGFTSYHSNDGTIWTQIGSTVNISMSSSVYIGLCATSHNDGVLTTASIDQVNVDTDGGATPTGNLALNKVASQSSNYNSSQGFADNAVDGNTNGQWGAGSVTHTAAGQSNAWWEVDLGATYPVGDIVIWNRTDCCSNRLGNFTVSLENTSGGIIWQQTLTSEPNPSLTLDAGGASGRIIRISQNLANTVLSLAEVQVYASGATPPATFPDPAKTYYIDVPIHGLRLAASGESEDPYTTTTGATGPDVEWQFVAKGNGSWHIQRAAGGSTPRLRTDNSLFADMQSTSFSGSYTYYDLSPGFTTGTYFLTLPDGPANYNRLQVDNVGQVKFVSTSSANTWESFQFTELGSAKSGSVIPARESQFSLYPNPASQTIVVDGLKTGQFIRIFDIRGKLILQTNEQKIDIRSLESGIYFVKVPGKTPLKFFKR